MYARKKIELNETNSGPLQLKWCLLYCWDLHQMSRMHIWEHVVVELFVRALICDCAMFNGVCTDVLINIQEDDIISWVEAKQ